MDDLKAMSAKELRAALLAKREAKKLAMRRYRAKLASRKVLVADSIRKAAEREDDPNVSAFESLGFHGPKDRDRR
jgi:hypothetical protein